MMIELKRYRNIVTVATCVGLCLTAFNLMLLGTSGPAPKWLVPNYEPGSWVGVERNQQRIAALESASRGEGGEFHTPFLFYIGQSSAARAIDPAVMRSKGCDAWPVGLVAGGGMGMHNMLKATDSVTNSPLKPSTAIFCLHTIWLVGLPTSQPPSSLDPLPALQEGDWGKAGRIVRWWIWLYSNRPYVYESVRRAFDHVRTMVRFIPSTSDPWSPLPTLPELKNLGSGRSFDEHIAFLEKMGWFDPEEYTRHQQSQAEALLEVIARFRKLGCRILVLLMPEQSRLRKRVPLNAKEYLLATIRRQSQGDEILDFQDALPDSMFLDAFHVNDVGRERFSTLLAEWIKERHAKT